MPGPAAAPALGRGQHWTVDTETIAYVKSSPVLVEISKWGSTGGGFEWGKKLNYTPLTPGPGGPGDRPGQTGPSDLGSNPQNLIFFLEPV